MSISSNAAPTSRMAESSSRHAWVSLAAWWVSCTARAMQAWGETYFRLGIVLRSIYDDEDWRDANYANFVEYIRPSAARD